MDMPSGISVFSVLGVDGMDMDEYNENKCSYLNERRKEKRMAFSCRMYWKEECDGCGGCMEEKRKQEESI